jgi:F-type H+-transporting ATPase subunit a
MQPPTQNINTNVGMALSSFLVFNAVGLKRDPVGYIKHIMGPVWWLVPLMFIVELVSLAARPITLALRLTANLYGDHLVFTLVSDMTSPIPVAWVLMPLAIMVSGIQAFVFALLSTIYIALSLPHDDHH